MICIPVASAQSELPWRARHAEWGQTGPHCLSLHPKLVGMQVIFFFLVCFSQSFSTPKLSLQKQRLFCVPNPLFTCRSATFTTLRSWSCNICTTIKRLKKDAALQPAQFTHSINYASKNISPALLQRGSCLWFECQIWWLHLVATDAIKHQKSFEAELSRVE